MTEKQQKLYFRRWGAVRRILRQRGFSASEADAERKAIHARANAPASAKAFNNSHLDAVLEEFDAILQPDRLPDRQSASAKARIIYSIRQVIVKSDIEHPEAYAAKIIAGKCHGKTLADLETIDLAPLRQLLITLRSRMLSRS